MASAQTNGPITSHQPNESAGVQDWVSWFGDDFLPGWTLRARDPESIGFFDLLDEAGQPMQPERRTILAQARLLFTFSHLALMSDNPAYHRAARIARAAIPAFRKAPGLYRRAINASGEPTDDPVDDLAFSYDLSFVILGLSAWGRLTQDDNVTSELDACWSMVETVLTDPATGLMLEHDGIEDPASALSPNRAQNPHMHLYEAALQTFEMTGTPIWLERAARMRAKGLEYFLDSDSGTITEFIAPDLSVLPGRDGARREIGHQCEWAWLLFREVELSGDPSQREVAMRMLGFADRHGFSEGGFMHGAAFDAVSADVSWREDRFLLWPQTEAIKAYAVRATEGDNGEKAQALALLIFRRFFAGRAAFANQLDSKGRALWPDALSRLLYHLVLALTEGARAGLWRYPG